MGAKVATTCLPGSPSSVTAALLASPIPVPRPVRRKQLFLSTVAATSTRLLTATIARYALIVQQLVHLATLIDSRITLPALLASRTSISSRIPSASRSPSKWFAMKVSTLTRWRILAHHAQKGAAAAMRHTAPKITWFACSVPKAISSKIGFAIWSVAMKRFHTSKSLTVCLSRIAEAALETAKTVTLAQSSRNNALPAKISSF